MNHKDQIREFILTHTGSAMTIFTKLYNIVIKYDYDTQVYSLQYLCENYEALKRSQKKEDIVEEYKPCYTDEQLNKSLERLRNKHFNILIMQILENAFIEEYEASRFYYSVWDLVQDNKICKTKREKILAFYNIVCFDYLPYMNIGIGVKMDNEKYNSIIQHFDNSLKTEIEYIIKYPYDQKTQESSLLLERILSLKDKEQQIVLLAVIISRVRKKVKDDVKESIKYI